MPRVTSLVGWGMDLQRVIGATAIHLFQLYMAVQPNIQNREEAIAAAGTKVFHYLTDCGMDVDDAIAIRNALLRQELLK